MARSPERRPARRDAFVRIASLALALAQPAALFAVQAPLEGTFDTAFGRAEVSHVGLNDQVVERLRQGGCARRVMRAIEEDVDTVA